MCWEQLLDPEPSARSRRAAAASLVFDAEAGGAGAEGVSDKRVEMDRSVTQRFAAFADCGLSLRPLPFPFPFTLPFPINCIVAHRLVACTANEDDVFVVNDNGSTGAQDDDDADATEEMEDVRDGRDETSEYWLALSKLESGDEADEIEVVREVRRASPRVGKPPDDEEEGNLGFHSEVRSSVHLARQDSWI